MVKKFLLTALTVFTASMAIAQVPDPCPSNTEPPADICQSTCIYCDFNGITSTTTGYTGQTPPGFCGTIENEQWLGFIAGGTTATFTATPSNCVFGDGIQIALYTDCNSAPVGCYGGCSGCAGTPASITITNMIPGVNYFLLIDGFAGDQCDFQISVVPASAVQAPNVGPTGAIQGASTICPGGTANFGIPVTTGAGAYIWTGPPGSLINGMPSPATINAPDGNNVSITFGAVGGQVCVQPVNSCNQGTQVCKNVAIVPIPPTNLSPVTVCAEDAPYETPWGQFVNTTGAYQTTLTSYQGCDSIVKQTVTVKAPIIKNLSPQSVCAGTCITICGEQYCEGGQFSHVCTSFNGCDSTILFSILLMDPTAEILGGGTLSCSNTTILLNSSPTSAGNKLWKNLAGQILGTGNTLSVGQPGTYILTVTASAGGVFCIKTDTVVIDGNTTPPSASATGGILGCGNSTTTLNAITNGTNPTYQWAGPNGFTSGIQNPTVNLQGTYTVTVTNSTNGCTASTTATVTGDTIPPNITTSGGTLSCAVLSVQINASSSAPNSGFSWSGPGGFTSTLPNPVVGTVGNYLVTVTNNANNCTSTATAVVNINNAPPGATANGGTINCTNPTITINGGTPAGNPVYAWTGPNGFSSALQNPSVDTSGTYQLTVTGTNGCTSTATAVVVGNTNQPGATANGGLINCGDPDLNLSGSSDSLNVSWAWTGPNGFTANTQNPTATAVGNYILTVTGANSCTSTATAVVTGDFVAPDVSTTNGIISCSSTSTTISGNSNTSGVSYSWVGPGNFSSALQTPTVSNTGTYTLTVLASNGCTSTATAQVTPDVGVPDASANGGTLDCNITSITIDGNSNTNNVSIVWNGPNGFSSTLMDPSVSDPGVYTLTVTNLANGCTAQANATVNLDDAQPGASASGTTLTCSDPSLSLSASSPTNNVTWSWSGPNGFVSASQNPVVNSGGTYTVTVTGPNGCTSTATADALVDQTDPIASATTGLLTCSLTAVALNGSANTLVSYHWTGPNGFDDTTQSPNTTEPGDYTLVVTAANGCTDDFVITVNQDITPPDISAAGNTIDCNNPQVVITGNSATGGAVYAWTGPNNFNSNQANPIVGADGNYLLTVTGPNGCTSTAPAVVLIDTVTAILAATPDAVLTCSATSIGIQADVTIIGSSLQGLAWTGPGGFNATTEDPAVMAPGLYTLVATMTNGCTSDIQVTVNQDVTVPNISATGNTISCAMPVVGLNGGSTTSGTTFAWTGPLGFNSTLEDPTVNADGVYTLTVTGPNGCTSVTTATVNLDTNPPGATAVSQNDLDCDDLISNLTATSPAGNVSYVWSGPNGFSGTTQVVSINQPGAYDVTITGANGCTSTANVDVAQDIAAPGATAQGDTIDCITGVAGLLGNSSTSGVNWNWNGPNGFNSNQQNPTVPQPGTYILTVTGQNACTSTATAVVEQNTDAPVVNLSGSGTLTCALPSINLSASIGTPNATGVWTGPGGFNSTQNSISVVQPGTYTYTVTAVNGCISAPEIVIPQNIQPPQGVTASGGLLNCTSPTISLNAGSTTSGVNYHWSGPGGFDSPQQNPAVNTPGTYTVTVTDPINGCTTVATAVVTQDPTVPDINVTTSQLTCATTSVTLDAQTTTPNVLFQWTGPNSFSSTLENPVVNTPGQYTVVATATSGCTSSFDITVDQDIVTPDVSATGLTLTCTSPSGTITGSSATPGVVYLWSGPGSYTSNQASPTVSLTGTYTLTVTAPNGCTNAQSVEVLPDASIPQVAVTGGTVTCAVSSIQLTASSQTQNITWNWSGPGGFNSTEQNPVVTAPGNYTLVVTAANGCTNATAASVQADTEGPDVGTEIPEELDCTTIEVILNGFVQTPGSYQFNWSTQNGNIVTGANTQTPTVSQAGLYTLVVTNNTNGCTSSENVQVLVDPATPSAAVLDARGVSCKGYTNGTLLIDAVQGGTPPFLYSVDNGPLSSTVLYTSMWPGIHSLLIQDANGCELQTSFNISEPDSLYVNLGADTTIEFGQPIYLSLDNTVNIPERIEQVIVKPDTLASIICPGCSNEYVPPYSFQFRLTVVDSNGCTASDLRLIIVDRTKYVYIPNIFNPELSDQNGLFMIFGRDYQIKQIKSFQVFDRWGSMVHEYYNFAPNDPVAGWDGKINGTKANPAVFVYYAEIEFVDGETILFKGDVTLIRQ